VVVDNSPVNIVTACVPCNNRKANRTPGEARMPLLTSQSALRVKLERVVLCHYAEARAEWRKYLFMDVHDDRDVMEKVRREQKVLGLWGVVLEFLAGGPAKTKGQRPKAIFRSDSWDGLAWVWKTREVGSIPTPTAKNKDEGGGMRDETQTGRRCFIIPPPSSLILWFARVAQLTERWSYKPEVEGLSPSLGTRRKDEGGRMKDEEYE
jgi:hypothetical protein